MVDMGILSNNMKPLSLMLHNILKYDHIQWLLPLIRYYTNSQHCYRTGLNCRFWPYYQILGCFSRMIESGATNQQRTLTIPNTWSCHIWDLHVFLCWEQSHLNLSSFRTLNSKCPRNFYIFRAGTLWRIQHYTDHQYHNCAGIFHL